MDNVITIKRISGDAYYMNLYMHLHTLSQDVIIQLNILLSSRLLLANFVEHILFGALHLDNCPQLLWQIVQLLLTSSLCLFIPREEEKEKKRDNETGG